MIAAMLFGLVCGAVVAICFAGLTVLREYRWIERARFTHTRSVCSLRVLREDRDHVRMYALGDDEEVLLWADLTYDQAMRLGLSLLDKASS